MFRASSAHLQEDTVVHMQHIVPSLSMRVSGGLQVHSTISAQKLVINIQSIHDARSEKHQVSFTSSICLRCPHPFILRALLQLIISSPLSTSAVHYNLLFSILSQTELVNISSLISVFQKLKNCVSGCYVITLKWECQQIYFMTGADGRPFYTATVIDSFLYEISC